MATIRPFEPFRISQLCEIVDVSDDMNWYIGAGMHDTETTEIIIPVVAQLYDMTESEIGAKVRELMITAVIVRVERLAQGILYDANWCQWITDQDIDLLSKSTGVSALITTAFNVVSGEIPHPNAKYQKQKVSRVQQLKHPGYIYILKSELNTYKIGRTGNIEQRMRSFGVQLPFPVSLIHVIQSDNMIAAERNLHNMFHEKRVNGEWFRLDVDDISYLLELNTI